MLITGSVGKRNMEATINQYQRLFEEHVGKDVASSIIRGTSLLPFIKRIWELERLFVSMLKSQGNGI